MAQTSNKKSGTIDGPSREHLTDRAFKILEQGNPTGWFWCHERRDYYRYHDWMEKTGIGKNGR